MTAQTLAVVIVAASALPANAFPVLYTWWKDWWRSPEGRHLFFFVLGLAALIDLSLARRVFGPFPGFEVLALATYALICWQLWRRLWLLVKYNGRRAAARRQADEPVTPGGRP